MKVYDLTASEDTSTIILDESPSPILKRKTLPSKNASRTNRNISSKTGNVHLSENTFSDICDEDLLQFCEDQLISDNLVFQAQEQTAKSNNYALMKKNICTNKTLIETNTSIR